MKPIKHFSAGFSACCLLVLMIAQTKAQTNTFPSTGSAGIGTTTPNASALLEIKSTTKGLLIPRMTVAQRNAIATPATGLMIFQTNNTPGFYFYNGTTWTAVSKGANTSLSNLVTPTAVNQILQPNADNTIDLGTPAASWKNMFIKGGLYINGVKMMQYKAGVNTLIGENAGSTGPGGYNTAIGTNVLSVNTTGNSNVGIGENSLIYNTTGNNNTAIGYAALISNNTGSNNVANGFEALYSNISGNVNTATGKNALYYNTTGSYNTAVGVYALENNNASENTAVGVYALQENTTGSQNSAVGAYALSQNTEGSHNTATGMYALAYNTTGYQNAAFGYKAMYSNETGRDNAAFGYQALLNNSAANADGNSAFGSVALYANVSGGGNTAMGYGCMTSNFSGGNNTAVGYGTLENNTTGNENVAVGVRALNNNKTGSQNTAIGNHSNTNFLDNLNNVTVIGYNTQVDASNKVRIGNGAVTSIGGQVGWTSLSDGRVKKEIKENVPGIKFIKMLRPVTFHYDVEKENELLGIKDSSHYKEQYEIEKNAFSGFVAQEVEEAANKINYEFSGVDKTGKMMGLRYADFVVPLVKAVQELATENDKLKSVTELQNIKIETQQQQLDELKRMINSLQQNFNTCNVSTSPVSNTKATSGAGARPGSDAMLFVNSPNPFNQSTIISYTLPPKFITARIIITDNDGKIIKQLPLSKAGSGNITFAAGALAGGTYHYALFVDEKMVDSKKMELIK